MRVHYAWNSPNDLPTTETLAFHVSRRDRTGARIGHLTVIPANIGRAGQSHRSSSPRTRTVSRPFSQPLADVLCRLAPLAEPDKPAATVGTEPPLFSSRVLSTVQPFADDHVRGEVVVAPYSSTGTNKLCHL